MNLLKFNYLPVCKSVNWDLPAATGGTSGNNGGSTGSSATASGNTSLTASPVKTQGNDLIVSNCLSCHSAPKPKAGFLMNKEGRYTKDQADLILARSQDKDAPMPPKGLLTAAQQKEIENYLKAAK